MALQSGVTILNKYRIVKLLGEGGMARVWLAEELTFGKRLVALKEPRPNPLSDDAAEIALRYQREVQVCAELEQAGVPQIVRAITAEPYEEGLLLVMAYMPGGDLASLINQHPNGLPPERAVAIALDVLAALAGAHSHPLEIIHRDVKPSNILFDKEGRAYLADFGLAQLAGVSGRSQLRGGQHPGTPPYMAPEQERSTGYLSPTADLFALGCVLWEILTGQRYKRHKPGTPPSQLRRDTPAWLDEVVMRTLAEDAWERWSSAGEMAEALRAGPVEAARRKAEVEAQQRAQAEAERRKQQEAAERARREEEARQKSTHSQPASTQSSQGKAVQSTKNPGNPSHKQPVKKQRGTALTVVLVLVTLGAIVDALILIPLLFRREVYEIIDPVVLGGVIVMALLGVVGVVGMWFWKRWGIYLFVASVAVSIYVGLVYPSTSAALLAMIPLLILGYGLFVDNKRALFD